MYSIDEQLIIALKKRDFATAEGLLAQGADINARNNRGETPAYFFSENQSLPMLQWLVDRGADLNLWNDEHETPLFRAVKTNDAKAVDFLLNAGADVNIPNKRLISPVLQTVLSHKDHNVLERLLQANPDLDAASETQTTAVVAAAAAGKANYVAMLLDAGADPETADQLGQGLLHAAVLSFEASVLATVIDKAPYLDPNYAARSGSTPMSLTLHMPHMTSMLLDIGGDPNAKTVNKMNDGMTLLMGVLATSPNAIPVKKDDQNPMGAMGGGSVEGLVEKMLTKGADAVGRDDHGRNPGFYAINSGAVDQLPRLIAHGLDPARPMDPSGLLPYDILAFTKGADFDDPQCLTFISEWHAMGFPFSRPEWDEKLDGKWTKKHSDGFTPHQTVLQHFLLSDFTQGLKHAVTLGALVNEQNHSKATLAHTLVQTNYDGMSASYKKALSMALKAKNIDEATKKQQLDEIKAEAQTVFDDVVGQLNSAGLDWNAQNDKGQTPLHLAVAAGNITWTKRLLMEYNVNPSLRDAEGLTPAGVALKAGYLDLFTAIERVCANRGVNVRQGVVLDTVQASSEDFRERQPWLKAIASIQWTDEEKAAVTSEGQNAVYLASATGQHDVVRALLKMGFDPNTPDNNGNTALMQAAFNEDGEVIRLLRAGGAKPDQPNAAGQNAYDVANYVKTVYVHNALNADDLGELISDLLNHPLSDEEKAHKAIAEAKVENVVRQFTDEPAIEMTLSDSKRVVTIFDPVSNTSQVYGQEIVETPTEKAMAETVNDESAPTPARRKGP